VLDPFPLGWSDAARIVLRAAAGEANKDKNQTAGVLVMQIPIGLEEPPLLTCLSRRGVGGS